jgi:hypothetical protein
VTARREASGFTSIQHSSCPPRTANPGIQHCLQRTQLRRVIFLRNPPALFETGTCSCRPSRAADIRDARSNIPIWRQAGHRSRLTPLRLAAPARSGPVIQRSVIVEISARKDHSAAEAELRDVLAIKLQVLDSGRPSALHTSTRSTIWAKEET